MDGSGPCGQASMIINGCSAASNGRPCQSLQTRSTASPAAVRSSVTCSTERNCRCSSPSRTTPSFEYSVRHRCTTTPSASGVLVASDSTRRPVAVVRSVGSCCQSSQARRTGLRVSNSSRPPGARPAAMRCKASCQSWPIRCIATFPLMITRSAHAGSISSAVPRRHSTRSPPGRARATRSMASAGSIPTTARSSPVSVTVSDPVPQPRSTIRRAPDSSAARRKYAWSSPGGLSRS